MISRRQLATTILQKLDNKDQKQLARSIAAYLVEHRRSGELSKLMRDVKELRARGGIVEADVTTAHALNAQLRDRVEDFVKRIQPATHKVLITENVDASAIGGIRISAGGKELDATVQEKLKKLKRASA